MRREGCKRLACLHDKPVFTNATVKNHALLFEKPLPKDIAGEGHQAFTTRPQDSVVHYLSTIDPHRNRYNEHCRGGWKRKKQRNNRRERVRRRDARPEV